MNLRILLSLLIFIACGGGDLYSVDTGANWRGQQQLLPLEETSGWFGYQVNDDWTDTGNWLGWLYVEGSPWVYSPALNWNFVNLESQSEAGAWVYSIRSEEMLVYDWNKEGTIEDSGFFKEEPPRSNFDLTSPVDYTDGTIYVRVEIRNIPVRHDMVLRLFWWQRALDSEGVSILRESGIDGKDGLFVPLEGTTGNVVVTGTFSFVDHLVHYGGGPVDWKEARTFSAVLICLSDGYNKVSGKEGVATPPWSGEDPNDWYPLDIRFTAVLVAKGSHFSGWGNYINNTE